MKIMKIKKYRFLRILTLFLAVSLAGASIAFASLGYKNHLLNHASTNSDLVSDQLNSNNSSQKDSRSADNTFNVTPSNVNIKTMSDLNITNPSLFPTFKIANSNSFQLSLNRQTNAPAINLLNSPLAETFLSSSPSSNRPLNEVTNSWENKSNNFLGYQKYSTNTGEITNDNNFGSTLSEQLLNPNGNTLLVESKFENINNMVVNPNEIGIFSISTSGTKQITQDNSSVGLFTMESPLQSSGNSFVSSNSNFIPNTKFFYNLIVVNKGNSYAFYAPTESTKATLLYNGSTDKIVSAPDSSIVASDYVNSLLNGNNNELNFFQVNVSNAINNDKANYSLVFTPNDKNGVVSVDLVIKNAIDVIHYGNDACIYSYSPTKTFEDVITLQGFKPTNTVSLNLGNMIGSNSSTDLLDEDSRQNLINLGNLKFAISSKYASLFGSNTDYNNVFYRWPSGQGVNANQYQPKVYPFDGKSQEVEFLNFGQVNSNIVMPQINENWTREYLGQEMSIIPSISNFKKNSTSEEAKFNLGAINGNDNSQWISVSTWDTNVGFNKYLFDRAYSSNFPTRNYNGYVQNPYKEGGYNLAFNNILRNKSVNLENVSSNSPIAVNLRVRNDYDWSGGGLNNTFSLVNIDNRGGIVDIGNFTPLKNYKGSYLQELPNGGRFEYLTGILTSYEGEKYWNAPREDTNIVVEPNGGIGENEISDIYASDYLNASGPWKYGVRMEYKGAITTTITDTRISAYANDANGYINVTIHPGVGVESNFIKDNFAQTNSPNSGIINEYRFKALDPVSFQIKGFKPRNLNSDTHVTSTDFDMSKSSGFDNRYITYAVDEYLTSNQTIANVVSDNKYKIIADVIANCFENVYNLKTLELINPYNGNDISNELRSQIKNPKIEIPAELAKTGYNYLNLSFDLQGYAENGQIQSSYKHYEFKLKFKEPEKKATVFNPKINLALDAQDATKINVEQIKYLIQNYTNEFWNFLLTGYFKNDLNINQDDNLSNFNDSISVKLPVNKLDGLNITQELKDIPFKRNELIYGYPSDFIEGYKNISDANSDELAPINSWTFDNLAINSSSVTLNLYLKYYVNSDGIISYNPNGNKYGIEFIGDNILNTTTKLTQNLFIYPNNNIFATDFKNDYENGTKSYWNEVAKTLLVTLADLPESVKNDSTNLEIINNTLKADYVNGIVQFDLGLKKAKIHGNEYSSEQNNDTLFNVGKVTITNFKLGVITSLKTDFYANTPIEVNGQNVFANSIYPSDITENMLKAIITNDGFVGLINNKSDVEINFNNLKQYVKLDNLAGTITLNPDKNLTNGYGVFVTNYYDESGEQSTRKNFLTDTTVVIRGFNKAKPTRLTTNSYTIQNGTSIVNYNETNASDLISTLLEGKPPQFNSNSDIVISNFKRNILDKKITFNVKLKYYFDNQAILKDYRNENNQNNYLDLGNFEINGFTNVNVATTAKQSGIRLNFSKYIGSNYVTFNDLADDGTLTNEEIKNTIINAIVNSLKQGTPLINNAPEDLKATDIDLKVNLVDNTKGLIRLKVMLKKYWDINGEYHEENSPSHEIGLMDITGFKILPSEETKLNNVNKEFVVDNKSASYEIITKDLIRGIISNNARSIFDNLPVSIDPNNDQNVKDNPTFNTNVNLDQIDVSKLNVDIDNFKTENGIVKITNLKLNSYYKKTNNEREGKIVWVTNEWKSFGDFTLKGFNGFITTTIKNRIDVRKEDNNGILANFVNTSPNELLNNQAAIDAIKLFIKQNAIINWYDKAEPWENFLIFDNLSGNNLTGEITARITITNWSNDGKPTTDPLSGEVVLFNFKQTSKTTIPTEIRVDAPYSESYAYEIANNDDIKQIILSAITSKPGSLSINDIEIQDVQYDNFNGTIKVLGIRLLKNYYDIYGNIAQDPEKFNDVAITNFKKVTSATSINKEYVWDNQNSLPFQYWKQSYFLTSIKSIIKNNLIVGSDTFINQLTNDDIEIVNDSISDNNIEGTLSFTVKLKKYFDQNGRFIDASNNLDDALTQDVVFSNFNKVIATDIITNIDISGQTNIRASDYLTNNLNDLKTFLFNKVIIGKWQGFDINNISIENQEAKNSTGKIVLDLKLSQWIDQKGKFHDDVPFIKQVTINGFMQVQATSIIEIATAYNDSGLAQTITVDALRDFIFNHLVVNKPQELTKDDLELDYENRIFNNSLRQLTIKVRMKKNYNDINGNIVSTVPSDWYTVNLSVRDSASPTTILPTIDITKYYQAISSKTSYDFAKDISNATSSLNETILNINNINNEDFAFRNLPSGFLNNNFNIEQKDIIINSSVADNGVQVIGIPKNGQLALEITLNKYFDNNSTIINVNDNNPPKTFTTILTGFKPVDNPTSVPKEIKLENWDDKIASDVALNTSNTSALANEIANKITNWNKGTNNSNLQIIGLIPDNVNGTINATISIKSFTNEDGLVYENNWSQNYQILIKGFKKITPTTFNGTTIYLSGSIGNDIANILNQDINTNYSSSTDFEDLNLNELQNNSAYYNFISYLLFQNIKQNFEYIFENPTSKIVNLFNGEYNQNLFNEILRFSVDNFLYDYKQGTLSFEVSLLSYYSSSDGSLIENIDPLTATFRLVGFKKLSPSSIITSVFQQDKLSNIVASDWQSNINQLKTFIYNNQNIFFKNPSYSLKYVNIKVENVQAYNLSGILVFDLSVNDYFGEDGYYHNSPNDYLTSRVVLEGFKRLGPTQIRNLIDVTREPIFGVDNIEELTPTIIRDALYQNRNGTQLISSTFTNLPDSFSLQDIQVLDRDQWSIDYNYGTVSIPINLLKYNNDQGVESTIPKDPFMVTITGLVKRNNPTTTIEELNISNYASLTNSLANNVSATDIESLFYSNKNFLNEIFKDPNSTSLLANLPANFDPYLDIRNVELLNYDETKPRERRMTFEYKNYFKKDDNGKIFISDEWKPAQINLTNFKDLKPTSVNNLVWNLSSTNARNKYTGEISELELESYANEVKKQYIENPAIDGSFNILTNIKVEEIRERDGAKGEIVANVILQKYIGDNFQVIPSSPKPFTITFSGFNQHVVTCATSIKPEIHATDIFAIPSTYLKTSNDLIEELNKVRDGGVSYISNILGTTQFVSNDKLKVTKVVDILGLDGKSIYDEKDPGKIRINDEQGFIEFQLMVANTFETDGTINANPSILKASNGKPATIKLFMASASETKLKQSLVLDNISKLTSSAETYSPTVDEIKNYIIANQNLYIELGNDGSANQQLIAQSINVDLNNKKVDLPKGTVSYQIQFNSWWKLKSNAQLKNENSTSYLSNCTDDSRILDINNKETFTVKITGFNIVNKQKDNWLFYLTIAIAGTLLLLLLIAIIALIVRRKQRSI